MSSDTMPPAIIEVLSPGLATSVQDSGRSGLRHLGVGTAGAADAWSHALANMLVGNSGHLPTLEITLSGPTLRFGRACTIALSGAAIAAHADGVELPVHRPVRLPAGTTLVLGRCLDGARTYLAVAGGFDIPHVLGSGSTDLRSGFGGLCGRRLQRGDRLSLPMLDKGPDGHDRIDIARWWIDPSPLPHAAPAGTPPTIRVLPGRYRHDGLFDHAWQADARSNRQGLRLQGVALELADAGEQISEPVVQGTVQLPPDGQPIVLLCEAQTHGGYPRIGHVIRADWPLLAQLRPGDRLEFAPCSLPEAHAASREQQQRMARLAMALESGPRPRG